MPRLDMIAALGNGERGAGIVGYAGRRQKFSGFGTGKRGKRGERGESEAQKVKTWSHLGGKRRRHDLWLIDTQPSREPVI